jgi:hypothetical protein
LELNRRAGAKEDAENGVEDKKSTSAAKAALRSEHFGTAEAVPLSKEAFSAFRGAKAPHTQS